MRLVPLLAVLLLAPAPAAATPAETARDVAGVIGYSVPAIGATLTTIVNGASLAYGGTSTRGWRIAGWILGGVEIAIGAGMLLTYNENSFRIALGTAPIVLGVASLATATFVDPEPPPSVTVGVAPLVWQGGAGACFAGRF